MIEVQNVQAKIFKAGFNLTHWGSAHYMKYSNPAVDELLEKARGLTDQNQRKGMYQRSWPS